MTTSVWNETIGYLKMWLDEELVDGLADEARLVANGEPGRYVLHLPAGSPLAVTAPRLKPYLIKALEMASDADRIQLSYRTDAPANGKRRVYHALKFFTAWEILTTDWPKPIFAVGDLLPAGLTILAGRQKVGKSWLALQITRQVALGETLWGRDVMSGNFLYIALEDNQARLRSRMEKQQWLAAENDQMINSGFMLREQFESQIGYLDDEGAAILAQQIERQHPRLIVIDTLGRAVRGDLNDYEVMTAALGPLQAMAMQTNCAILLLDHHNKRGSYGESDPVLDVLGSGAKTAVADTIWGLYKRPGSGVATLGCLGRDVESIQLKMQLDSPTGLWQIVAEGGPGSINITPKRREILDILTALGPSTVTDIAGALGENRGNTYQRLSDLVDANLVERLAESQPIRYQLNLEIEGETDGHQTA